MEDFSEFVPAHAGDGGFTGGRVFCLGAVVGSVAFERVKGHGRLPLGRSAAASAPPAAATVALTLMRRTRAAASLLPSSQVQRGALRCLVRQRIPQGRETGRAARALAPRTQARRGQKVPPHCPAAAAEHEQGHGAPRRACGGAAKPPCRRNG